MKYSAREDIIQLTPEWKGDRLPDGRPNVSADVIARIRNITMEEAWGPLWMKGYKNQFVTGFQTSRPDMKLTGRAVTCTFVPGRPDLTDSMLKYGHEEEGRKGFFNQWVIDSLIEDDVVVVDLFDKIRQGTFVGGNLSTAIATKTKRGGLVCWGGVRDLEQIAEIENLQTYFRGEDPTAIGDAMMASYNGITRIDGATCLPGDIVHCTMSGVIFIPAHLAEEVVEDAEKSQCKDIFGFQRLGEGIYSGAQIDGRWEVAIFEDFLGWLKNDKRAEPYAHLNWDKEYEDLKKWWEENPTGKATVTL